MPCVTECEDVCRERQQQKRVLREEHRHVPTPEGGGDGADGHWDTAQAGQREECQIAQILPLSMGEGVGPVCLRMPVTSEHTHLADHRVRSQIVHDQRYKVERCLRSSLVGRGVQLCKI
eukprot:6342147-Prymnesium_polylepis.1